MTKGKIIARGKPADLIAEHAGRETAEIYGPPDRLAEARRHGRVAGPSRPARRPGDRGGGVRARGGRSGSGRRRPPRSLARGRVRAAHWGGGGVSESRRSEPTVLEPAAITGVMSREIANFRTFWKATTFSSVLEPIVYLLAFGLGLGATVVSDVDGLDYVEFVGTGMVATAVIFSSALPAMFGMFVKHRFQMTRTTRSSRRRSTSRSWSRRRCCGSGSGPASMDASRCWSRSASASTQRSDMLLVPLFCFVTALGFAAFGITMAAIVGKIDSFSYVTTLVITPLFLVAGTFFPIDELPEGFQVVANVQPALPARRTRPARELRLRVDRPAPLRCPRRVRARHVAGRGAADGAPPDRLMRRTRCAIFAAWTIAGCGGDDDEPAANAESAGASGAEGVAASRHHRRRVHRRAAAGQAGHPAGLRRRQRGLQGGQGRPGLRPPRERGGDRRRAGGAARGSRRGAVWLASAAARSLRRPSTTRTPRATS